MTTAGTNGEADLDAVRAERAGWEAAVAEANRTLDALVEPRALGGVAAERISASDASGPDVLLHLHGGGFTAGSPRTHRGLAAALAAATGRAVILPDYRLAPEHPFPAALDDAVDVYAALLADGHDPNRIAVGGDSAGAALAAGLAVRARDAGLPRPGALLLLSPWLDLTQSGASMETLAALDPMVTREELAAAARLYLQGRDPRDPLASPLFAELDGLPPALIQIGEREVLRDDATRFAERLRAAGGRAEVTVWPGMTHVFHADRGAPSAGEAIAEIAAFLRDLPPSGEAAAGR